MADSPTGMLGPPILDGYLLDKAAVAEQDVAWTPLSEVNRLLPGGRVREASRYMGAGAPLEGGYHEITLRYNHLGEMYDRVTDLLAAPGEHTLVLWKRRTLVYAGDGARVAFTLPWPVAYAGAALTNFYALPPGITVAADSLSTEVKNGIGGIDANGDAQTSTSFTVLTKDSVAYAAGSPAAGEAWFLEEGQAFKVGTAPASGERLYVRIVPIIPVLRQGRVEAKYPAAKPNAEPRDIVLLEA